MQKLNGCPNYEDRLRQYEDLIFSGQANEYFDLIVDLTCDSDNFMGY